MKEDLQEARRALASLLHKCERAQEKLAPGTWQWTSMKNTVRAARVALSLAAKAPETNDFTAEDLEEARQTLSSALQKSEKARQKTAPGTPQQPLIKNRISALRAALPLIESAIAEKTG